jgi:hypothetical protein
LIYTLAARVIGDNQDRAFIRFLPAGMTLLFGLARMVWVHHTIAEIYTFGLLILAGLLLIALWDWQLVAGHRRLYALAFLGGLGVFHHRALAMVAPALLYAVWRDFRGSESHGGLKSNSIKIVSLSGLLLLIGLIGFLPYVYLPLRAQAGAAWVYGEPGTWDGFWDQFWGREASRFIAPPLNLDGILANFTLVSRVVLTDVTVPGLIAGLLGLWLGLRHPARRRAAITFLLSGGLAYGFHSLLYTDILAALILPITLSLAFGWLFLGEWALRRQLAVVSVQSSAFKRWRIRLIVGLGGAALGVLLLAQNFGFIGALTSDTTGLETIRMARGAPNGSTLMLDWGPRYFAVGFGRDVLSELPGIRLVSHKADFRKLVGEGLLVTPDFTFYNRPVAWWEQQLEKPVYLTSAAAHLVQINIQPVVADNLSGEGVQVRGESLICTSDALDLSVDWLAASPPERDWSVFVHLLDRDGNVLAQGDQAAPVYGWRPTTTWLVGEVVRDIYPLPRLVKGVKIRYGLYYQAANGEFVNANVHELAVDCER